MKIPGQLEAVIIPTGNSTESERRARKAVQEHEKFPKKVIVSGSREDLGCQYRNIYEILREGGVKDDEIEVNYANNTLENVLNSLKKLDGHVKIVSNKTHLSRFRNDINYLKRPIIPQGDEEYALPEDLDVDYIPVGSETMAEKIYGVIALFNERYRLSKGVENALNMGRKDPLRPVKDMFNNFYDNFRGRESINLKALSQSH